nr:hypothetical protein [Prevotella intermedia]
MNSYKSATFGESGITAPAYADNKSASYTLSMGYDNMHRITSKRQHLSQTGVQFSGTLHAGYELSYTYGSAEGKKFQLDNVRDINYRTEELLIELLSRSGTMDLLLVQIWFLNK